MTTADPAPPVPVIVIWSIGAVAGSGAISGYQVRLVPDTVAAATSAPPANAVTVPGPARLTATSATAVPSAMEQMAGLAGGGGNGHTAGLTWAPSSAGGIWAEPSPVVACPKAAATPAGTPWI